MSDEKLSCKCKGDEASSEVGREHFFNTIKIAIGGAVSRRLSNLKKLFYCVFAIISIFHALVTLGIFRNFEPGGGDFSFRYNEVQCLKAGYNPADIHAGRIHILGFRPFYETEIGDREGGVHGAYPPYAYYLFLG